MPHPIVQQYLLRITVVRLRGGTVPTRRHARSVGESDERVRKEHCCIKVKGVLARPQSGREAPRSGSIRHRRRPSTRRCPSSSPVSLTQIRTSSRPLSRLQNRTCGLRGAAAPRARRCPCRRGRYLPCGRRGCQPPDGALATAGRPRESDSRGRSLCRTRHEQPDARPRTSRWPEGRLDARRRAR
jgi:hypothetical protein